MSQDNAPDLNAILRTLSAFSNQTASNQSQQQPGLSYNPNNEDNYEPPEAHPQILAQIQPQPQPQSQPQAPKLSNRTHPQPLTQDQPKQPSANITTWPAALKQVMRTVATNEEIQRRIRHLIRRQHEHERQWWKGRQALLEKQSARKEKKRELDEVLRKVGAPVDEKDVSTAAEDQAEITNYDAKVYRASRQMADAMLAELKALDVPFFCTSRSLVTSEGDGVDKAGFPNAAGRSGDTGIPTAMPEKQGRLSVDELVILQKRMLELLRDLCRE
ncbi:uncharacterized protein BDV14DRAFT_176382 [Aspergillus stella-maris]|uniref:uncharacterized protein n=1 Tax=Aspergillus stella-maris TaxID=1810926 RepID=UPI003CCE35B3